MLHTRTSQHSTRANNARGPPPHATGDDLSDSKGNCLHPLKIVHALDQRAHIPWNRLLFGLHYGERGLQLERTMGSPRLLLLVDVSMAVAPCIPIPCIPLAYFLCQIMGLDEYSAAYDVCAVGCSAVLFSLKYVWNRLSPEAPLSRYTVGFEMVLMLMGVGRWPFSRYSRRIFVSSPSPSSYTVAWRPCQASARATGRHVRPRDADDGGPLHVGRSMATENDEGGEWPSTTAKTLSSSSSRTSPPPMPKRNLIAVDSGRCR